jgi:hypothetical protein
LASYNKALAEWIFSADYFLGRGRTLAALHKVNQTRAFCYLLKHNLIVSFLQHDEAVKDFNRVLELHPDDTEAKEELELEFIP